MKKLCLLCALSLAALAMSNGQQLPDRSRDNGSCSQRAGFLCVPPSSPSALGNTFDVTYYKLNLNVSAAPGFLSGIVTVKAKSLVDTLHTITLDLANDMSVDSVRMNGGRVVHSRDANTFDVRLNTMYRAGQLFALDVFYRSIPASTGFGSFLFSSHSGTPWVWSLSEPYGASDWWPCKNQLLDKADSADILITCDASFKVGSNGKLISVVENGNGTKTHHWSERYPIAAYLISIALTNFTEFSNWFRYTAGDSMQVLNYVLPEHLADAQAQLPKTVTMLQIFSEKFGLYPFINEKYGHAEFGRGGAMEHQTMTSTTTFEEFVIAHELAHQWFGDMITCGTWSDLWLNEGFARYSEAIYGEAVYGTAAYRSAMEFNLFRAERATGTLYVEDTANVSNLFNGDRVYAKGASVLHMLRHVLGDSVFFRSLKAYATDPTLRFKSATTGDFRRVCETVAGRSLGYFFAEWVYGELFPQYMFDWKSEHNGAGYAVTIRIDQTTNTTNPLFFIMPIDFKLSTHDWDTTVVLFNTAGVQEFTINTSHNPTRVVLDPDHWILKSVNDEIPLPTQFSLDQNYPNPFNAGTVIRYHLPHRVNVHIAVYNVLGQEVATLIDGIEEAGSKSVEFSASSGRGGALASGIYFYRLQAGGFFQTRKLVVLR